MNRYEVFSNSTPLFRDSITSKERKIHARAPKRHEGDLPPDYALEFERGYRAAGGALPPNWRRLAKLLDLLNLCEFLNTQRSRPRVVA